MVDVGPNIVANLQEGLNTMVASARFVRDHEAVMVRVVDRQRLAEGSGTSWREVRAERLAAQDITDTTELANPQQYELNLIEIEPTMVGGNVMITDRVKRRLDRKAFAQLGGRLQQAMEKKKDRDGLAQLDAFSTSLAGAGSTITSGHITTAVSRIKGNDTETGMGAGSIHAVLHPYHIKALEDELKAAIGTYEVTSGLTEQVYRRGLEGVIATANIWNAGNMLRDSSDDAKGAVFAQQAIILVEGFSPRTENKRRPEYGGGADEVFMYDEYKYGERRDEWGFEILADAADPTS